MTMTLPDPATPAILPVAIDLNHSTDIPTLVQVVEVPVLTEQVVLAPVSAAVLAQRDVAVVGTVEQGLSDAVQQQIVASVLPRIDALLQAEIQRAMERVLEQQAQSLASLQALLPTWGESLRQDCANVVRQCVQDTVAVGRSVDAGAVSATVSY